ncbi:MAG TPA: hypothetical protein VNH44_11570 [Micropepsaceae bacterium]|nr:hypothetical protein [Micropepsaceae bacterium]
MTRGILLSAVALTMLAAPAFAQDRCSSPLAPVVPDGKTSTVAQLSQAAKDVVAFIKASDEYQTCLLAAIAEQDKLAKDPKNPPDPAIKKALEAKGDANQAEKVRVGTAYNAAAAAYKAAHPK